MTHPALSTFDLAIKAAAAYGRSDIRDQLMLARARFADPAVRVLVVGEFKQGKSSLVNALVNAAVCPVDTDLATSVPTAVQYSDVVRADAIHEPEGEGAEPSVESVPLDQLARYCAEFGNPANRRKLRTVEIGIPRPILSSGLVIVDTPGVGGLGSAHTATTLAALPLADAVLFVTDASQEFSGPELEFLDTVRRACPNVRYVLTKIDFYPEWEKIRTINQGHLSAHEIDDEMVPTSAQLRQLALRRQDSVLNDESGYPRLVAFLTDEVVAEAQDRSLAAAHNELAFGVDQLRSTFAAEQEVLSDPEHAERLQSQLAAAKEKADALRSMAARWQVTLNDGVADLTSDLDHALRGRMRSVTQEAEAAIEAQDPGEMWDEFEPWMKQRVTFDVTQTYLDLSERTNELSQRVAEHFADDEAAVAVRLDPTKPLETAGAIAARTSVEVGHLGAAGKGMLALRGSYGGLLMFGMLSRMVGLVMFNPATLVIGLLMGRKALKDERERQIAIRRQQARTAVRQFVDEASFQVGKELRDSLRAVQRQLRDHYTARADQLNRSVSESLTAAKSALQVGVGDQQSRLEDVRAELSRIDALQQRIAALGSREHAESPVGAP